MPLPNVFISHRWDSRSDYYSLVEKFELYGLKHADYSVPKHDPLDVATRRRIAAALTEQVRQCNYFIIFANRAIANSDWCMYELAVAKEYKKPILGVVPYDYQGGTPPEVMLADNQGGPVGFHGPAIIRRVCESLTWPVPRGL
jgi:hypothetical protein